MSKGDNSPGASKFAGAIRKIMDRNTNNALVLDFGVIQSDGSLLTDEYPISIPKSDYLVCRHLKARSATAQTTSATVGDHGDHRDVAFISRAGVCHFFQFHKFLQSCRAAPVMPPQSAPQLRSPPGG